MTILNQYGWTDVHQKFYIAQPQGDLLPGRVVSIRGFKYDVITEKGILETELSGKLMFASQQAEIPKVGDWILFMDYTSMGYIIDVFPRVNALTRKVPGEKSDVQVLAANVDGALVVQGLDRDFNVNRIERYLFQIISCGIAPIVILNKADLVEEPEAFRAEVLKLQRDCVVHLCSTYTGAGMDELREKILEKGKTYLLVGSSGVGKSSIMNALLKNDLQKTKETSESTSKGKHTTTTRDLFMLPNGSLLIDTPGMREFGVTGSGEESAVLFPVIEKFAAQCKFSDCRHLNEAGCAVISAVASGALEPVIYDNYLKLVKEQRRFEIRAGDHKKMGKVVGKMVKEAKAHRKKYKF